MKNSKNPLDQRSFPVRFAEWVLEWRWPVLISSILLTLGMGYGAQFIEFNTDYHVFFSDDNPQLMAFDELQDKYTKDDNVFIVIQPRDGEVFTRETLAAIETLTEAAWQTPYSTRVDALTNFQHTRAVGDDLYVEDLVESATEKTDRELAEIKSIAVKEPLLVHRLVNETGTITAVNITVKIPGESITEMSEIVEHVRKMTGEFEKANPELNTYLSGMVMLNGAFQEAASGDMTSLVPLMFLVIILTIFLATRSISSTIAAVVVILLSIMAAMGLTGWLGIQLTPPSASAPTIIMTLAIADSIHILITFIQYMRKGFGKKQALIESIRLNFMPVFLTSLTTVIGFLTMNFSDAPPFHDLGNITAIGMTAAFLFSMTTLPALIMILPVRVKARKTSDQLPLLDRLAEFVILNNKRILWVSTALILGATGLALRNDLSDEFVEYFGEGIQFRTDTDFISDNLTGIYTVEFSLAAGESGGVNNPEYLHHVALFEDWLYEQPEVVHVNSYVEVAKRVNKSMHGDSLAHYRVPGNRQEAAQYLLLYEMSLPFGLDLNNQINVDKSESRMTVTMENVPSSELIAFSERAEDWLEAETPAHMFTRGVSPSMMFANLSKRQLVSMISGTALAIALISFVLMLALRSFKFGALSLIPNIAPIAVGFGVWAVYSGTINVGIAIVFGMTLGIIVDDTVHFLSKYLRAVREQNKSPEDAVRYAFSTVGKALVVTTVVLGLGFAILAQSQFAMNSGMAQITVIIISLALVIDFLLLPALLITFFGNKKSEPLLASPVLFDN